MIRVLLLADSHLGYDLPLRGHSTRRRRGFDFLANYAAALAPALAGEVDVVVHGGDVFDRPDVPPSLAYQGLAPLVRVAERGVPVLVVPGNHERSRLPHARFAEHRNVHVFDRARTFRLQLGGLTVAFSGFPYERRDVRSRFPEVLERTGWRSESADVRVLCVHHCVEGATVGPGDFTFTSAADVIRIRDVPAEFAAVFSGHIHRQQVLATDLQRRPVVTPVLYPGSIERTAFAEAGEPKGFMRVQLTPHDTVRVRWQVCPLPARPMLVRELAADRSPEALTAAVRALVASVPADAVLRIRVTGELTTAQLRALSASRLRPFVPPTMNIEVSAGESWRASPRQPAARRAGSPAAAPGAAPLQLELG